MTGIGYLIKSYIYKGVSDQWTEVRHMSQERQGPSCGVIDRNGQKEVVVAGAVLPDLVAERGGAKV
jgi:hypothetical protein